jgi:hypothetical protein
MPCCLLQISNYVKVSDALETFDVEERALAALEQTHPDRVSVLQGAVTHVNAAEHKLTLADGSTLAFDKLCICSGAAPRLIADHPCVIGLRDTESVEALATRIATARRVVVIGNGGIALGLVHQIRSCPVVWAVKDAYIGSTFFDASASRFLLESGASSITAINENRNTNTCNRMPLAASGTGGYTESSSTASGVAMDDAVAATGAASFSFAPSTSSSSSSSSSSAADGAAPGIAEADVAEDSPMANVSAAAVQSWQHAKDISEFVPLPPRGSRGKGKGRTGESGSGGSAAAAATSADRPSQPKRVKLSAVGDGSSGADILPVSPLTAVARQYGASLGPSWTELLGSIEKRAAAAASAAAAVSETTALSAGVTLMTGVEITALKARATADGGVLCDGLWHRVGASGSSSSSSSSSGAQQVIGGVTVAAEPEPTSPSDVQTEDNNAQWPLLVRFSNDAVVGCDVLVSATGVTPCTDMLPWPSKDESNQGFLRHTDGGLLVNDEMQTTGHPDVYAAGDVASVLWPRGKVLEENASKLGTNNASSSDPLHPEARFPLWFQMRLWSQARLMGSYAGRCMAGTRDALEKEGGGFGFELFAHMFTFLGHKVVLLGAFNGQGLGEAYEKALRRQIVRTESACEVCADADDDAELQGGGGRGGGGGLGDGSSVQVQLRVTPGHEYIKIVLLHGKVVGAMLIGDTDLEETFENLILNRLDVRKRRRKAKGKGAAASAASGTAADANADVEEEDADETGDGVLDLLDPDVDIEDYFD